MQNLIITLKLARDLIKKKMMLLFYLHAALKFIIIHSIYMLRVLNASVNKV